MSSEEIDIVTKETKGSQEEDDLEEGELKDDDDDDDDDEEEQSKPNTVESSKSSQSSERQSSSSSSSSSVSSSSSSSSSSDEEDGSQSRASSKVGSSYGQPSRSNDSSFMSKHMSGDRYRPGRNRDREDPREKAAKLISMRTKLLEAKSREIEMKFAKNKSSLSPAAPIRLLSTISTTTPNLKMTLTVPSISYAENPKPLLTGDVPVVTFKEKKSKKSKKRKKKSKSSTKKHKKHKSSGTPKKKRSDSVEPAPLREANLPSADNGLHQGPRTPPDNVVVTLEDERIEWPSHLIRMTTALPSISFSVNPDSVMSNDDNPPAARKRRSLSSSSNNLNSDFQWFCDHFISSFEMDDNQAQHQAYIAMLSSTSYDQDAVDKWLNSRGFTRESTRVERIQEGGAIPLRPIQPGFTILKSQKEVILPNGQVLPPGTVQKVVHPYARSKDTKPQILGAYCDLLS